MHIMELKMWLYSIVNVEIKMLDLDPRMLMKMLDLDPRMLMKMLVQM